jgi:hypothetical protein
VVGTVIGAAAASITATTVVVARTVITTATASIMARTIVATTPMANVAGTIITTAPAPSLLIERLGLDSAVESIRDGTAKRHAGGTDGRQHRVSADMRTSRRCQHEECRTGSKGQKSRIANNVAGHVDAP